MNGANTRSVTLANGLHLIHLHTPRDPVSASHLFLPRGTGAEPENKSGLSTLMWSLFTKGSKKRSARQVAEDVESLGASIGGGATHDYCELSCHAISEYFFQTLDIFAELLFEPVWPPQEVTKERTALIAAIRSKRDNIFGVASEQLNHNLYGRHPYSRAASGTEKSVSSLTVADLQAWHKRIVAPQEATLVVASSLSFQDVQQKVTGLFGPKAWKKVTTPPKAPQGAPVTIHRSVSVVKQEKFEQAFLMMGFLAPPVSSKDYAALKILNGYLGGGMSTRLFQELREKQGLAYDVGSFYASKKLGSAFVVYMGLQMSQLETAKNKILEILKEMRSRRLSPQELRDIKGYMRGTYILDHQTNSQRAHYLGWWKTLGMGTVYDRQYAKDIEAVTASQVLAVARRVLNGKSVVIEVVPAKKNKPIKITA